MEAVSLRQLPALIAQGPITQAPLDWDWIYEDPDLAAYRASAKARPETPLSAFF